MQIVIRTVVRRPYAILAAVGLMPVLALAVQIPRTTTSQTTGTPSVVTEQLRGTVIKTEGGNLLVRMSTGELRNIEVEPTRMFIIDGKERSVRDLEPGTRLSAYITTTTSPVTSRTTTVGSGKVWHVSGKTVILTLSNGENKTYNVEDSYRFTVNGRKASVHELRPGMIVSAEKIVEEPSTIITSNVQVTGESPTAQGLRSVQ